jgi:hypothetical protein
MSFSHLRGIALIPGTGEFTYDPVAYSGRLPGGSMGPINSYFLAGAGEGADIMLALDQLRSQFPNCETVAVIVSWFLDSLDASACKVYPSSTYIGGEFQPRKGGSDSWRVSDVTLETAGLIPISKPDGLHASFGGTPSDQSIVRCLQEIKRRGFKAVLYPFLNVDATGKPWRGQVGFSPDLSSGAAAAVARFLGSASADDFTPDEARLTVHYSGDVLDFTYRRFILHYAHLATLAGGVSLFVIGSELNGLEAIRGPSWTIAGAIDGAGHAVWDYPFVDGLKTLASDVRAIFDDAGLARNLSARENLIVYSPDWTQWMGVQHADAPGIVPHLDTLYAHDAIDFVAFDNYAPLSDWTTGDGGLDARNWAALRPTSWPVADPSTIGFGLSGAPDIHSIDYLKSNIEGGEKGDFWYSNYTTSKGSDPNGSGAIVTAPQGDRLSQSRNRFYPGQELFAFKKLRWWWNNTHRAVYDAGDGAGTAPHGPTTQWAPHSKSIVLLEYGFPTIDKATNQPNVFYDPASVVGGVPFWCEWNSASAPKADWPLAFAALQAVHDYWGVDGMNEHVGGVQMIATDLMLAWTFDARPFPTFPTRPEIFGDAPKWRVGHWLNGKSAPPIFPELRGQKFPKRVPMWKGGGRIVASNSGQEARGLYRKAPKYAWEFSYDGLCADDSYPGLGSRSLQELEDLYHRCDGKFGTTFVLRDPDDCTAAGQMIGTGDGVTQCFTFRRALVQFSEPVGYVTKLSAVYVNGAPRESGWFLVEPNKLVFTSPPSSGEMISADFDFAWKCRFDVDAIEFQGFLKGLYASDGLRVISVSPE